MKALLPVVAALPLVVRAGISTIRIPLIGQVDFGPFYALVLVPLGITGAAIAVNMLDGSNGPEVGMGLAAMGSLAAIAAIVLPKRWACGTMPAHPEAYRWAPRAHARLSTHRHRSDLRPKTLFLAACACAHKMEER